MFTEKMARSLTEPGYHAVRRGSGLYLRITPAGVKSWLIRTSKAGEPRQQVIGGWPAMSLRAAEAAAPSALDKLIGRSPEKLTVEQAIELWYTSDVLPRYKSKAYDTRLELRRGFARLMNRRVDSIVQRELVKIIDDKKVMHPAAAVRWMRVCKSFFRWCEIREHVPSSPARALTEKSLSLQPYTPRQTVADDALLREVWKLPDEPYGRLLRFVLLTGCRIGEAIGIEPSEIEGTLWRIPAARTKSSREHVLPLTATAKALAEQGWPPRAYSSLHAWWTRRFEAFNPHDLRRTAATRMRELGVSVEIIEAVLNHAPARLVQVYQVADLTPQMRSALSLWEQELLRIVALTPEQELDEIESGWTDVTDGGAL